MGLPLLFCGVSSSNASRNVRSQVRAGLQRLVLSHQAVRRTAWEPGGVMSAQQQLNFSHSSRAHAFFGVFAA